MVQGNPFQQLFETFGREPRAHAEVVNRRPFAELVDVFSVTLEQTGRCVLLRAPRAGHGKTHMLSRLQMHYQDTHEFILLRAVCGYQIDATTVLEDVLRDLLDVVPNTGGLTFVDYFARRLFAAALQPLVSSGEVPCQDREGALAALRKRPIETFDFHHPDAITANWARENFEVLGERLAIELAQISAQPLRDVSFWVNVLFRYASAPIDHPHRQRNFVNEVQNFDLGESALMGRLVSLLSLLTLTQRVVLVADDLEGFSSEQNAALRLASFVSAIRQSVGRLDVILSLNCDVWEGVFVPCLSDGLLDRLSETLVELDPLTEAEMVALLDSRVPGQGGDMLARVNRTAAGTHARGLIREARAAWVKSAPSVVDSPAPKTLTPLVTTPQIVDLTPEPSFAAPVRDEVLAPIPQTPAAEIQPQPAPQPASVVESPVVPRESNLPTASVLESPRRPVDPAEVARVDELLRQFRERYGRGG